MQTYIDLCMQWRIIANVSTGFQESVFIEVHMPGSFRKDSQSHMPQGSFFFEKVVPALLILMGLITLGLILFAAAVLLGLIHF